VDPTPPSPGFKPRRLKPRDVAYPAPAYLRQLGDDDLAAFRASREARLARFDFWNPRRRSRLLHYVIGAVLLFPVATWFFTPVGFSALHWQIPIAAALGAAFALLRPTGFLAGALSVAAGLATQVVTGHPAVGYGLLMSLVFYGFIGVFLGYGERLKLGDGS
jgi:hypothetical protein